MELEQGPIFFFFQAEDGIRDIGVTGVQTCALPIFPTRRPTGFWVSQVDRSIDGVLYLHTLTN